MKSFLYIAATIAVFILVVGNSGEYRDGDEIRIYADSDLHASIGQLDIWLGRQATLPPRLALADTPEDADVTVGRRSDLGPTDAAVSYAYRGHIDVSTSAPASHVPYILLHELLHCAGEDHDADEASIMHPRAMRGMRASPEQLQSLRRLSGITAFERVVAQMRAMW